MRQQATAYILVLLRHGESEWNQENRFTGWTDVALSEKGRQEARRAGELLRESGYAFDLAYTSVLRRAIHTLWIVLEEMQLEWIPVAKAWQLNERHYGALQGLNKSEMAEKYGEAQVKIWRRSYDIPPPPLELDDERHPRFDRRYAALSAEQLPRGESLKDTLERVLPFWHQEMVPHLRPDSPLLIAAHGNSLRALIKHLDHISEEAIPELNIPTGIPLVYELDDDLRPLRSFYLGDPEAVKSAIDAVSKQGTRK